MKIFSLTRTLFKAKVFQLLNGTPVYEKLQGVVIKNARYVIPFYLTGEDTLTFRAKGASSNWIGSYHNPDADDNFSFYGTTNASGKYARYNGQVGGSSITTNQWYDVEISPTGVSGVRNPSSFAQAAFTCSIPLCIGATSPTGSSVSNVSFDGPIEVVGRLKLIPCRRIEDGVIGYYDGSTFYEPIIEDDGSIEVLVL